jgi:hypothetical protein
MFRQSQIPNNDQKFVRHDADSSRWRILRRGRIKLEHHALEGTDAVNESPKSLGPLATRKVYERLKSLQAGESFTVTPNDWGSATLPTDSLGNSRRYRDYFQVRSLQGGKGWVISRVK